MSKIKPGTESGDVNSSGAQRQAGNDHPQSDQDHLWRRLGASPHAAGGANEPGSMCEGANLMSTKQRKRSVHASTKPRTVSPVVQRLNTTALVQMGFTPPEIEMLGLPTLAVHFRLVEHGYEIHVFDEGKYLGSGCRDFSGSHEIAGLKLSLVRVLDAAVQAWRAKL